MSEDSTERPANFGEVIEILESFIDGNPKFTAPATQSVSEDNLVVAAHASMSEDELKLSPSELTPQVRTEASSAEQELIRRS